MNDLKLNPCPFCGVANAKLVYAQEMNHYDDRQVLCNHCGAKGPVMSLNNNAIDEWQKRATESALATEREALRELSELVRDMRENALDCYSADMELFNSADEKAAAHIERLKGV